MVEFALSWDVADHTIDVIRHGLEVLLQHLSLACLFANFEVEVRFVGELVGTLDGQ